MTCAITGRAGVVTAKVGEWRSCGVGGMVSREEEARLESQGCGGWTEEVRLGKAGEVRLGRRS